jgi:rare lipoprotein A
MTGVDASPTMSTGSFAGRVGQAFWPVRTLFHGLLALTLVILLFSSCAHRKRSRLIPPPASSPGATETGVASWYGHPYHGRASASGEIYDMEKLTAAHRTLPFDTWVRVFDLDTQKSVDVRIIDRGPFVDGRIIDLSHAAARAIDMIGPGTARVRIEVIRLPESVPPAMFAVQIGAFRDRERAERLRSEMQTRYGVARVVPRQGDPVLWRVLVGSESSQEGANALSGRIRQENGEKIPAFIVRLDIV